MYRFKVSDGVKGYGLVLVRVKVRVRVRVMNKDKG